MLDRVSLLLENQRTTSRRVSLIGSGGVKAKTFGSKLFGEPHAAGRRAVGLTAPTAWQVLPCQAVAEGRPGKEDGSRHVKVVSGEPGAGFLSRAPCGRQVDEGCAKGLTSCVVHRRQRGPWRKEPSGEDPVHTALLGRSWAPAGRLDNARPGDPEASSAGGSRNRLGIQECTKVAIFGRIRKARLAVGPVATDVLCWLEPTNISMPVDRSGLQDQLEP